MSEDTIPVATTRRKIAGERRRRPASAVGRRPASSSATGPSIAAANTYDEGIAPDRGAQAWVEVADSSAAVAPPPARAETEPGRPGRLEPGWWSGRVPQWALVGLAILALSAVAFDIVLGVRHHQSAAAASTRSAAISSAFNAAPAQAVRAATRILSYDYKSLGQDATAAEGFMTPDYAAQYQRTVDGLLKAPAEQVRAHVVAKVMDSGVVSATPTRVDILMFIDQTSETTAHAAPQTALNRVVFTMVRSGDRWLVDHVTAL
ncbi:MAG: hypothetical protein ACRDPG_12605 [Nocardioidaceae bacterium]